MMSDPLAPRRLPQQVNTNHNLMLHEQLFPAASRVTGFIIPEVTLDRLSRYAGSQDSNLHYCNRVSFIH